MQKFMSDFKNTKASNNFLRFLILVLVMVIAVEGAVMLNLMDKQRVIVVPINVDRKFSITGDSASPEYVEMMVRQIVYLKENFTPETVKENFKAFLSLISPRYYNQVEEKLMNTANELIKYQISQVFFPKEVFVKGNTATVTGIKKIYAGEHLAEQKPVKISIRFKINQGKFEVLKYEEMAYNTNRSSNNG
jgi:type IV conjugative transfer system protein TraE